MARPSLLPALCLGLAALWACSLLPRSFVAGGAPARQLRGARTARAGAGKIGDYSSDTHGWVYERKLDKTVYNADVGYFVDGTSVVKAGNALFRPPMPDPHTEGSPLPGSYYIADVGYLADGSSFKTVGNQAFRDGVDPHTPGSPLPPPPNGYVADVGYLVDGTELGKVGNDLFRQ